MKVRFAPVQYWSEDAPDSFTVEMDVVPRVGEDLEINDVAAVVDSVAWILPEGEVVVKYR